MNKYALILAGGIGTRFWPASRKDYPKQFLSINDDRSFLQLTFDRVLKVLPQENIYIVSTSSQVELIKQQLPQLDESQIVVEPAGRNTCPAIALGVSFIRHRDPDASVMVLPSDQLIKDENVFAKLAGKAMDYALDHSNFVVFGIRPLSPHTGYGYIQAREADSAFYKVDEFVEKPDLLTAKKYLNEGNYYWNSGMFVFSIDVFFDDLRKNLPEMATQFDEIYKSIGSPEQDRVINEIYPLTEKISIDYGIMEKATRIKLLPFEVGWNDVGSWSSLYDVLDLDDDNNLFLNKDSVAVASTNVVGYTKKHIAAVGVKDIVLVETDDTILICHKDKAQDVKKVLEALEAKGRTDLL